jgi:hypothetical protein
MGAIQDLLQEVPLSAVLRERVHLAEERHEAALRENAKLQARVSELEAENESLRARLPPLTALSQPALGKDTVEILVSLFTASDSDETHVEGLGALHGLTRNVVQYHLDELDTAGLARITGANYLDGHKYWGLTPSGRKYVMQNGLSKE